MTESQGVALDLFDAYHDNLTATGNNPAGHRIMLCPLCLGEIERQSVESGEVPLEHILPHHSTALGEQKTRYTQIATASVRSGLTITCRTCNQRKGSVLDWPMRGLIVPGTKAKVDYPPVTGTAILTYAYLMAFCVHGYEYVLDPRLAEIRRQFEDPHKRHTRWLEFAEVHLEGPQQPIVCNSWGYPFIMGGFPGGHLQMFFWRFRALLPSPTGVSTAVRIPDSIIQLAHSE